MASVAKITKIEAQKKNKNRVAVYLDEEFAFGLDLTILAKFNLKKGDTLSESQISDLLLAEEKKKINDNALRYLANRAHSEKELTLKLKHKGYAEALIGEIISDLKQTKFVNDQEFALSFARNRLISKPMGEHLLRQELWQKGIEKKIIDSTITQVFSEQPQEELSLNLIKKFKSRYKTLDSTAQKKKLHDFLVRRGFSWDVVNEVIGSMNRLD